MIVCGMARLSNHVLLPSAKHHSWDACLQRPLHPASSSFITSAPTGISGILIFPPAMSCPRTEFLGLSSFCVLMAFSMEYVFTKWMLRWVWLHCSGHPQGLMKYVTVMVDKVSTPELWHAGGLWGVSKFVTGDVTKSAGDVLIFSLFTASRHGPASCYLFLSYGCRLWNVVDVILPKGLCPIRKPHQSHVPKWMNGQEPLV